MENDVLQKKDPFPKTISKASTLMEGFDFLHNDVVCSTQDKAGIPKNWILLDSQSTVDVLIHAY